MKKFKLIILFAFAAVLVAISANSALAGEGIGNDPGLTMPPAIPDDGFIDGTWNTGKTKLSSPFAYSGNQDVDVDITYISYPDPGKGKTVFHYIFVADAPTKACFPVQLGSRTYVYFDHPIRDEWVKLKTKTEIHHHVKYRCAEVPANGYYGLIGK